MLVTQLCHADVLMYLLAVNSLGRFLAPAKVYVLDDTSLTARDRALLRSHVTGDLEIRSIATVENARCPAGGTWERLLFIADLAGSAYPIQLDADTLTLRPPADVQECVQVATRITLGTAQGRHIVSAGEAARIACEIAAPGDRHVQVMAEQRLGELPQANMLKYVRGNSGFTGFAWGKELRTMIEAFSTSMNSLIGPAKWAEMGERAGDVEFRNSELARGDRASVPAAWIS